MHHRLVLRNGSGAKTRRFGEICVDLTRLNRYVKRERHILPSVDQVLAQVGDAKVFSKLDATSGFWQIELAPESSKLTTFITPYGRYMFNRLHIISPRVFGENDNRDTTGM